LNLIDERQHVGRQTRVHEVVDVEAARLGVLLRLDQYSVQVLEGEGELSDELMEHRNLWLGRARASAHRDHEAQHLLPGPVERKPRRVFPLKFCRLRRKEESAPLRRLFVCWLSGY
jgi:hypothetical protein